MPKKRHLNKYSKPQSTAPASLSSSAASRNNSHQGASPGVAQHRPALLVRPQPLLLAFVTSWAHNARPRYNRNSPPRHLFSGLVFC